MHLRLRRGSTYRKRDEQTLRQGQHLERETSQKVSWMGVKQSQAGQVDQKSTQTPAQEHSRDEAASRVKRQITGVVDLTFEVGNVTRDGHQAITSCHLTRSKPLMKLSRCKAVRLSWPRVPDTSPVVEGILHRSCRSRVE
jgi:hypothetical protein